MKLTAVCEPCVDTYGVHDGVGQHDVADVDSGNQTNKAGDHVGVIHIYGLSYGLEAK